MSKLSKSLIAAEIRERRLLQRIDELENTIRQLSKQLSRATASCVNARAAFSKAGLPYGGRNDELLG